MLFLAEYLLKGGGGGGGGGEGWREGGRRGTADLQYVKGFVI